MLIVSLKNEKIVRTELFKKAEQVPMKEEEILKSSDALMKLVNYVVKSQRYNLIIDTKSYVYKFYINIPNVLSEDEKEEIVNILGFFPTGIVTVKSKLRGEESIIFLENKDDLEEAILEAKAIKGYEDRRRGEGGTELTASVEYTPFFVRELYSLTTHPIKELKKIAIARLYDKYDKCASKMSFPAFVRKIAAETVAYAKYLNKKGMFYDAEIDEIIETVGEKLGVI